MNNKMEENTEERKGGGDMSGTKKGREMIFTRVVAEHDVNERRV